MRFGSAAVLEPDVAQPCSLGRQPSRHPPPKRPGSKHDVTHVALTLSHELEPPPTAPLSLGSQLVTGSDAGRSCANMIWWV